MVLGSFLPEASISVSKPGDIFNSIFRCTTPRRLAISELDMELRKKLLIVYKTNESLIENCNVKQCVAGLNSIANMGNKRKDDLIQSSNIPFS